MYNVGGGGTKETSEKNGSSPARSNEETGSPGIKVIENDSRKI